MISGFLSACLWVLNVVLGLAFAVLVVVALLAGIIAASLLILFCGLAFALSIDRLIPGETDAADP